MTKIDQVEEAKAVFREVIGEDFSEYEEEFPETKDMDEEELASYIMFLARVNDPAGFKIPPVEEIYRTTYPNAPCPRCVNDTVAGDKLLSGNQAQCAVFTLVKSDKRQWESLKPDVILSGEMECPYFEEK